MRADGAFQESAFQSFGFYTVPDLLPEEREPPGFLIEGFLPVGLTFLSGAPKTRKSFLALQMAIAVATGMPFLGFETKKCDVAYFDLEGSKSRIFSRSQQMCDAFPKNIFVTHNIVNYIANGLVEDIRRLHQETPSIQFIIIDTYSRARGTTHCNGANAYDADVALLAPMQQMALEEKIAVLFVHHDKKGANLASDSLERLSGTMGISGSADCVMTLISEGKRFNGHALLEYNPRDAKGGELILAFDSHRLEWTKRERTDLSDNPLCAWIIKTVPDEGLEGKFYSYSDVYSGAYGRSIDNPGSLVNEELKIFKDALYTKHRIGVQTGCKSNGSRGIRLIHL